MPREYEVKQGDCISSIACEFGFLPDTIWNDPANSALKDKRKDPNILFPGDIVSIPDVRTKEQTGGVDQKHVFKKKGVPERLRIILRADDEPIANESYTLDIDGKLVSGKTNGDGLLDEPIPPNAKEVKLLLGEERTEYSLKLGTLNPVDETSGIQARLNNLGHDCGEEDDDCGEKTVSAIKSFQKSQNLEETGELDDATKKAIKDAHAC
jgi:N-acetylmuramoyl-L-alanine amidase